LLSAREVGHYLGFGPTRTYRLLNEGALPVVRIGSRIRVRRSDLDTFIEARLERGGDES
jgi:excisionase family DNA binding protein